MSAVVGEGTSNAVHPSTHIVEVVCKSERIPTESRSQRLLLKVEDPLLIGQRENDLFLDVRSDDILDLVQGFNIMPLVHGATYRRQAQASRSTTLLFAVLFKRMHLFFQ
jgi:hypothetical protein